MNALLLVLLLQSGLHWDTRCTFMDTPRGEPPVLMDLMYIPHPVWLEKQTDLAQVDSALTFAVNKVAERNRATCKAMVRHDDVEHIAESKNWQVSVYEPWVGWFRSQKWGSKPGRIGT